MNPFEIHTAPGGAAAEIESRLLESLHAQQPQAHNSTFSLQADDCDQRIIGGLTAATSYGWLLIKTLWVHPDQRGSGVGRALVQAVGWSGLFAVIFFPPFWWGYRAWWAPDATMQWSWPPGLADQIMGQLLLVALPEEAFYRGFVQSSLEAHWPKRWR